MAEKVAQSEDGSIEDLLKIAVIIGLPVLFLHFSSGNDFDLSGLSSATHTGAKTEAQRFMNQALSGSQPEHKWWYERFDLMKKAGIPRSSWWAVEYIVFRESTWNMHNDNPGSRAFGFCQANGRYQMNTLNGVTYNWPMGQEQWQWDPVYQLAWCHEYIITRYGSWKNAVRFYFKQQYIQKEEGFKEVWVQMPDILNGKYSDFVFEMPGVQKTA